MDYKQLQQDNTGLRPHQIEAKAKIFEAWNTYDAVMLQMPTGTGKTYLFTSLINDLLTNYKRWHKEINILIVAHRTELLDQISATLSRYGIAHGFIQGTREQHLWKRVQVGSIMSLLTDKNRYNVERQRFDYIIVDEAHHSLAANYVSLFGMFPAAKKLGVTATPCRLNHEPFTSLYEYLITAPQISWFIKNHLLADFDYVSIKPTSEMQRLINNSEVADTGDFVNRDLDNTLNNNRIRAKLFKAYEEYAKGKKGIIYAINKLHAANIAELYSSNGVKAVAIDCDTPKEERQALIAAFKESKIMVLVNVDIFTEGFDCPNVEFIQLARPTLSLSLYLQQVGRGLRVVEGKDKTIIIDNVGLYNRFGLPDARRMWNYHFKGKEDFTPNVRQDIGSFDEWGTTFDEHRLDEFDEEMLVVRGANKSAAAAMAKAPKHEPIREIYVCDYYLVRGTPDKFQVFPLVKRAGKITGGLSNCVFEYDSKQEKIVFTDSLIRNMNTVKTHRKLHTILSFAAALAKQDLRTILNTKQLYEMCGKTAEKQTSIFRLFELINQIPGNYFLRK